MIGIGAIGGVTTDPSRTGAGASIIGPAIGTAGLEPAAAGAPQPGQGGSFLDTIGQATAQLNADLVSADAAMATFAAGGSADLHTVILQMQEASIQLKLGVQIRDRLLEAYQDIMRLQV